MNPLLMFVLLQNPTPAPETAPKPVAENRVKEKQLLEGHKKAKPRLPMPPEGTGPLARVNNGRFRQYYLSSDFQFGGLGSREPDPELTLDNTFKVKLFWIASRANNCYYCLGHQEHKLSSAGVSEDGIAALDSDWASFGAADQAAFAFTKKLTHEPWNVGPADIKALGEFYTPKQILEMTIAVGGYNSMNRWTDGLNIPAEENGNFFKKEGGEDLSRFDTPTSAKYAEAKSLVAPLAKANGAPLDRPKRDSVEDIKKALQAAATRQPTLPLAGSAPDTWKAAANPAWVKVLATFTKSGKARYDGVMACQTKGSLSPKLRAAIAWVAAREDRALYAMDAAAKRLKELGLSEDEIYDLDGAATALEPGDRKALALVKKLTISPAVVADSDVESLRSAVGGPFSDKQVAEIVHHVCNASFFNRLTEAANLPVGQ